MGPGDQLHLGRSRHGDDWASRQVRTGLNPVAISDQNKHAFPLSKLYRSLFPILMGAWFGVGMPALRLEASPGAAGDLSRFAGVYAWPDTHWEVMARDTYLVMEHDGAAGVVGTAQHPNAPHRYRMAAAPPRVPRG